MLVATYSERIYKKNLPKEDVKNLQNMLIDCNNIKIKLYSDTINGKINDIDDINSTYIIENFGLNTYYSSIVKQSFRGIIKSQKELQKIYIDDYDTKIKNQKDRIKKQENKLSYWKGVKTSIINHIKDKNKKDKKALTYQFKNDKVYFNNKIFEIYEFELYVEQKIRDIKDRIHKMHSKLNRLIQKQNNLKEKPPVCCFGSKALFKKQITVDEYINNHELSPRCILYNSIAQIKIHCNTDYFEL